MNRPTDLLEPTVPDLLELDSDFLRLDFPFDLRGISLLNFRNCRRQLLQIFLQKHNFQKWTFPTGNYCKQQKAWQNWKNCQNDGADSFSIDNDDREADDEDGMPYIGLIGSDIDEGHVVTYKLSGAESFACKILGSGPQRLGDR